MSRELPTYRANLERLNELCPSKEIFAQADLVNITGLDRKTVNKLFPFTGKYISKVNLANKLAQLGGEQC